MEQLIEIFSLDELNEIIRNNKNILILNFTSPICPPCRMLEPVLEELVEKKLCSVVRINILENNDIANEFRINATPTSIIYKENKQLNKYLGYQPLEIWEEIIKKI